MGTIVVNMEVYRLLDGRYYAHWADIIPAGSGSIIRLNWSGIGREIDKEICIEDVSLMAYGTAAAALGYTAAVQVIDRAGAYFNSFVPLGSTQQYAVVLTAVEQTYTGVELINSDVRKWFKYEGTTAVGSLVIDALDILISGGVPTNNDRFKVALHIATRTRAILPDAPPAPPLPVSQTPGYRWPITKRV